MEEKIDSVPTAVCAVVEAKEKELDYRKKIFGIKKEIGKFTKNARNPHFNRKYTDLNSILEELNPLLYAGNMDMSQLPYHVPGTREYGIVTEITDFDSGLVVSYRLGMDVNDPKAIDAGSLFSYLKRYFLLGFLSLPQEDDDGARASGMAPSSSVTVNADTKKAQTASPQVNHPAPTGNSLMDRINKAKQNAN